MSAGKAIFNILSNDGDVSAIVGTKIYPYFSEENTKYPYIVYEQTGINAEDTKDGVACVDNESFDIELYSEKPVQLLDLATKVRTALDRYSGTVESIKVQSIRFEDEDGDYSDVDRIFIKIQRYNVRIDKT